MSVHTADEERRTDSEEEGRYTYEIHSSGALLIWVKRGSEPDMLHIAYGPGAWISVSGTNRAL
ncbi:hypothetical protein [Streptomyces sp. NPDC000880]